jgi:Ca-activated chloride channel family protein
MSPSPLRLLALPFVLLVVLLAPACRERTAAPPAARTPGAAPAAAPTAPVTPPPPEEPVDAVPETAAKEPAFDSNQWNSAVGLAGGAGGVYGSRAAARAESYAAVPASGWLAADTAPLSTFAADVDTASYTNVRRMLREGALPPTAAVRLEEFVNAQRYGGAPPGPREPFAIATEVGPCPWNDARELVRLAVRTRTIEADKVPPCNLVFLVDVSGSMTAADKLPLFQPAIDLLIAQLRPQDHVAMVTYAAGVATPLPSARGDEHARIREAVQALQGGGSTNGAGGLQRAYELARGNRVAGVNRVLLATDGDFNVGISSPDELERFIATQRDDGVFLSVLGFGTGNLKDDRLERLANRGNGVYAYVDDLAEGRRVLVEQFGATLMTVAKDVKLQVEWDPARIAGYRLLGYDNRALAARDFRDDRKDGGELGAGHAVTALYEIERKAAGRAHDVPLGTLRIRYEPADGVTAREVARAIASPPAGAAPSDDFRRAAAAAAFALALREREAGAEPTLARAAALAAALPPDGSDLAELTQRALTLAGPVASTR